MNATPANWLLYCRPGFEKDCAEETQAEVVQAAENSGFVLVRGKPRLRFSELTYSRQLIHLISRVENLPERDRLTPILSSLPDSPAQYSCLFLETPDTNEGKTLSGFTRRFQPLLENALRESGHLVDDVSLPRLHIFFPDRHSALLGHSIPGNSSSAHMGIMRIRMSPDAPSRSYLKLAEAFETLLSQTERAQWLKSGMTAVDLGAAPGGWSWHLAERGLKVTAVDNGPLKGTAADHPAIRHLREDGFRFRPRRPVDWVVCDMVEQPQRVAELMAEWIASGLSRRAIFNLKLPMKKRVRALHDALSRIRSRLDARHLPYRLIARQLYHDREEVTVILVQGK